jgi:predicted CXXCH cytochrome family protein
MFSKSIFSVLLLACFVMCPASPSTAAEKSCIDCHKKVIAKRTVHPAISQYARMEQGCPSCHREPHAKKKGALSLVSPVPDLCYMCHDKANFSKSQVHPPVAGGECLVCHNPHASDAPPLLTQPLPFLCQSCHPDKTNGKHILGGYGLGDNHPIQGRIDPSRKGHELGCSSCHHPHSSRKKNLLVNDEANSPANLCLVCHTKITVRPDR